MMKKLACLACHGAAILLIGGVIGIAVGLIVAAIIGMLGTPAKYPIWPVLLVLGCTFGTGLFFCFLPARKVAQVDPIVARKT